MLKALQERVDLLLVTPRPLWTTSVMGMELADLAGLFVRSGLCCPYSPPQLVSLSCDSGEAFRGNSNFRDSICCSVTSAVTHSLLFPTTFLTESFKDRIQITYPHTE